MRHMPQVVHLMDSEELLLISGISSIGIVQTEDIKMGGSHRTLCTLVLFFFSYKNPKSSSFFIADKQGICNKESGSRYFYRFTEMYAGNARCICKVSKDMPGQIQTSSKYFQDITI